MAAWAPGRSRSRGPAELLLVPPCPRRAAGPQKLEARRARLAPQCPGRRSPQAGPRALITRGVGRLERGTAADLLPTRTFHRGSLGPQAAPCAPTQPETQSPALAVAAVKRGARQEFSSLNLHQTGAETAFPLGPNRLRQGWSGPRGTGRLCWNPEPRACFTLLFLTPGFT